MLMELAQGRLPILFMAIAFMAMAGLCLYTIYRFLAYVDQKEGRLEEIACLAASTNALVNKLFDRTKTATAPGWLENPDISLQSLDDGALQGWGQLLDDSTECFKELMAADRGRLSTWRDDNSARLHDLLASQELQRRNLANMEEMLRRAKAEILSLRTRSKAGGDASAELAQETRLQNAELVRIRREREQLQREMSAMQEKLQGEISRRDKASAELMRDLEQLHSEKQALASRYEELEKTHQRTLQEKVLIEEAFIKIDRHLEEMGKAAV